MKNYSQFHDGLLDGLLLEGDSAYIFLSTEQKDPFVLQAHGVTSLMADQFRQGNIIYEVLLRSSDEISQEDVTSLFGFKNDEQAFLHLEKVRGQQLCLIEINCSYGASVLATVQSVSLIGRQEWKSQHFL